jgi:hypothetical protein
MYGKIENVEKSACTEVSGSLVRKFRVASVRAFRMIMFSGFLFSVSFCDLQDIHEDVAF